MINVKLTTFNGTTKTISFDTAKDVRAYINALPNALSSNVTLHVACDMLGISGHLSGKR